MHMPRNLARFPGEQRGMILRPQGLDCVSGAFPDLDIVTVEAGHQHAEMEVAIFQRILQLLAGKLRQRRDMRPRLLAGQPGTGFRRLVQDQVALHRLYISVDSPVRQ